MAADGGKMSDAVLLNEFRDFGENARATLLHRSNDGFAPQFTNGRLGGCKRKGFAAPREGKKHFFHLLHHVPAPAYCRQRKTIRDTLAKCRDIGGHLEGFLSPAQRIAKAGDRLIEYQKRASSVSQLPDSLEISRGGLDYVHRLHDHGRDLIFEVRQQFFEGREVAVRKTMRQLAASLRHALVARGRADVPVLPAMIAADQHVIRAGKGARDPNRTSRCVRSILAEAHHL